MSAAAEPGRDAESSVTSQTSPAGADSGSLAVRRPFKRASWMLGVMLVVLAAWAVTRAGVSVSAVWATIRGAAPARIALLLLLIAATPVMSSAMFFVLQRRYTRFGFGENTALIASAWLLNFLPLAPGLVGRLAYLKAVHATPISHSARAIIWANVLSLLGAVVLLLAVAMVAAAFPSNTMVLATACAAPLVGIAAFAWYAYVKRPPPDPEVWRVVAALAIRYAELHLWGARYWALFEVMSTPIAWGGALALAGVAGLASLFPIAPNGLGLREWAVGIAAPLLPISLAYSVGINTSTSLAADLVHRGCEVLVAVPVGLLATLWVGARLRAAHREEPRT